MLENIKRIGLFIIVAQTFMHFAAGKQYEKYMKIISGVIVLLLFVSPFASSQENFVEQWQEQAERMAEQIGISGTKGQEVMSEMEYGTTDRVIQQMEEEIKTKLNYEIKDEECTITNVMIRWESDATERSQEIQDPAVKGITITLQRTNHNEDEQAKEAVSAPIAIEKIQIETGTGKGNVQNEDSQAEHDAVQERKTGEYRNFFAELLGIDADRVEVVYGG